MVELSINENRHKQSYHKPKERFAADYYSIEMFIMLRLGIKHPKLRRAMKFGCYSCFCY